MFNTLCAHTVNFAWFIDTEKRTCSVTDQNFFLFVFNEKVATLTYTIVVLLMCTLFACAYYYNVWVPVPPKAEEEEQRVVNNDQLKEPLLLGVVCTN